MKVGLINQVRFGRNTTNPQNNYTAQKEDSQSIEFINDILKQGYYKQYYYPKENEIILQYPASDVPTYTIQQDGTVVRGVGFGPGLEKPTVILNKNQQLADYVKQCKTLINALNNTQKPINFGNAENQTTTPETKTQSYTDKVNDFKTTIKDKNWSKKYDPKTHTLKITNKSTPDEVQYLISSDGTVTEYGSKIQPSIIAVQDKDAKKLFDKKSTTLKEKTANFWKFFAATNKMAQATTKGLLYGAITALSFLSGSWLFNTLPKAFAKDGPKFKQILRHPIEHIGKSGKIMAAAAGCAVFAYQFTIGKLKANRKTADIEHQLKSGHRNG